jgi:hypothetical protein
MSVWTSATDQLQNFLAAREVMRQQALAEQVAREDREYRTSQSQKEDLRHGEELEIRREANRNLDRDRQERLARQKFEDERANALILRQTMTKGAMSPEDYALLEKHKLAQGVAKKTPGVALRVAGPKAQQPEGALEMLPTKHDLQVTPESFESLGGTEVQEQARQQEFRRGEAEQQRIFQGEQKDEQRRFEERIANMNAGSKRELAMLIAEGRVGQKTFDNALKLGANWQKASADLRQVNQQYSIMESQVKELKGLTGDARNAAVQAIVATYNKILDPISVVRESEYARTYLNQGWKERMRALGQLVEGKSAWQITDDTLRELSEAGRNIRDTYQGNIAGYRHLTEKQADFAQVPRSLVFDDPPKGEVGPQLPGATQPPPAGPRPVVPIAGETPEQKSARLRRIAQGGG